MSAALVPSKFYGTSLPRPPFYTDVKLNDDPPAPVLDPFLSWAEQADWSKGGLTHRRNGRIEGNLNNLRSEPDNFPSKRKLRNGDHQIDQISTHDSSPSGVVRSGSPPSTPPAPVAIKRRRRFMGVVDDDVEERESEDDDERKENSCVGSRNGRFPARKLWEDFNSVAEDGGKNKGTPLKNLKGRRISPRLVKRRQS